MKNILRGFTLSEVLIALGIIGVVSTLTMSSLHQGVSDKALTAQLIKADASLTEGIKRYMAAEDIADATSRSFDFETLATEYLDVLQVCDKDTRSNCFADKYKGGTSGYTRDYVFSNGSKAYILKDGTTISYAGSTRIFVDINGKEKPNKAGQDLQLVSLMSDGALESFDYVLGKLWEKTPAEQQQYFDKGLANCTKGNFNYCYSALKRNGFKHLKSTK